MSNPESEFKPEEKKVVKITTNLPVAVFRAMAILAHKRNVSMTEVIRQAISSEFFLERAMNNPGSEFQDPNVLLTDEYVSEVEDEFGLGDFDINDILDTK